MKKIDRRSFLKATAVSAITLGATACGTSSSSSKVAVSTPSDDGGETPVTIIWWDYNAAQNELNERMVEEYKSVKPNVTIEFTNVPNVGDDYWPKLASALTTPERPTLFSFHNQQTAGFMDALEPFPQDLFPHDEMAERYFAFEAGFLIDGEMLFFPGGVTDGQIYYNKDIFAAKGIPEPSGTWTWTEFSEIAQQLTEYDANGSITLAGFASKGFARFMWMDLLYQAGGFMYDESGTKVAWGDSDAGLKATQFFYDLFNEYKVESGDFLNYGEAFGVGVAAMAHSRTFYGRDLDNNYTDINYGVMPIPVMENGIEILGRNNYECTYAVGAGSDEATKRAAFEFMKWMNTPEYQVDLNLVHKRIPADKEAWGAPELLEDKVLAVSNIQVPKTMFTGDIPGVVQDAMNNMLTKLYSGTDPQTALDEAIEEANAGLVINPPAWVTERQWKEIITAEM